MIVRETEPCTYSRLLAGKGLIIWWADITDMNGDVESIQDMERRTLTPKRSIAGEPLVLYSEGATM